MGGRRFRAARFSFERFIRKAGGTGQAKELSGFAAAFAFATIFAFAAHVAGVAAALAFAAIEAFTAVLAAIGRSGGGAIVAGTARDREDSAGEQSGHGCGNDEFLCGTIHCNAFV